MKHLWTILLVLSLSACGAGAAPGTDDDSDDGPDGGSRGAIINQTAGVAGYPGATDVQVSEDGLDTRVRFATDATLEEVYTYFDGELSAQGWQRTGLETDDDEIEADYAREGRELELELEREDDGGFEVEIDIDRDNAAYNEDDDDDDGDDGDDG